MKKIILATTLVFGVSALGSYLPALNLEANAAESLKNDSVTAFKKGTLKGATGKIGVSFSTLQKKSAGSITGAGGQNWFTQNKAKAYKAEPDMYGDIRSPYNDKTDIIQRTYKYSISKNSVDKKLGKPYASKNVYTPYSAGSKKEYYYKAGKYRVGFIYSKNKTVVSVGTSKSISHEPRS